MRSAVLSHPGASVSATRPARRIPRAWLLIAAAALLMTVLGAGWQARQRAVEEGGAAGSATLGGLTAQLHEAGWLGMDGHQMGDDNQGGFQMPAQMMPGAPTGDNMRFGVPVTLVNTGTQARRFTIAEEFSLGGGRNEAPVGLHSDTFGQLSRLSPGSAVDGVLYFDTVVPDDTDEPLYLLWTRDGETVRLAIPLLDGGMPDHEHAP